MATAADRYTDKIFSQLESQISGIYKEARKDIAGKIAEFTRKHRVKDKEMQKKLKKGEITQTQYQQWLTGQIFIGNQWQHKKDQINETIKHVMQEASNLSHGKAIDVFAENGNYTAFDIEQNTKGAVNFSLYDATTVSRLIREEPELLPRKVVNGKKLEAWNQKQIANSISQGIIQGETIDQISKRVARDTCISAGRSSMLYARTAVTGAQNAGRVERMKEAQEMGIQIQKRWMCTLDGRTRDAHRNLDGQTVDVDEPFKSDLGDIMYPGDPSAHPANVYNCRCTLVNIYPKYQQNFERTAYLPDDEGGHKRYKTIRDMTYNEWKASKQSQQTQKGPSTDEFDGGDAYIAQLRKETAERDQKIKEAIEEYRQADRDMDQLRNEQRRLDDYAIALGPMGKKYPEFDQYATQEEFDKHRDELSDEIGKLYEQLDSIKRPRFSDFANEDDYYKASNEYHQKHDAIRGELAVKEKELYNYPRWKDVVTYREAREMGIDEINRRRSEFSTKMQALINKRNAAIEREAKLVAENPYNAAKLVDNATNRGIEYSIPAKRNTILSDSEIALHVGGGDLTTGSCASLGFCYVGQKEGYDVLDFRGGQSQDYFSRWCTSTLKGIAHETGKPLLTESTKTGTGGAVKLIKQCELNKEYYFTCGRHAAIVRVVDDNGWKTMQYFELQSGATGGNGWQWGGMLDDRRSLDMIFNDRFGCSRSVSGAAEMMKVEDMMGSKLLHRTLGYINTNEGEQKKGAWGHVK